MVGEIQRKEQTLTRTTISYLDAGKPDSDIIVFLHGFPENSWSWESYLTGLSDRYHLIAPDLPGFNFSCGFVNELEYAVPSLVACMAEFIEHVGLNKKVHLVAHDWGGVIAWPLAAFHDSMFNSLTIINAAHPSLFTREILTNSQQQKNSDYIADLCAKDAYERVARDDFYFLKRLYAKCYEHLSDNIKHALNQQWQDRTSMQNSFNYYKQMPVLFTARHEKLTRTSIPQIFIKVPCLVLWGMQDLAFVPEVLDGMDAYVERLSVVRFEDDDHWLHHRQAEHLIELIAEHCARNSLSA